MARNPFAVNLHPTVPHLLQDVKPKLTMLYARFAEAMEVIQEWRLRMGKTSEDIDILHAPPRMSFGLDAVTTRWAQLEELGDQTRNDLLAMIDTAVAENNLAQLESLTRDGGPFVSAALGSAAVHGQLDTVKFIVEHRPSAICLETPLLYARAHGNQHIVDYLLKHGTCSRHCALDCKTRAMACAL